MHFLSVEGVTGQEANIAAAVSDALKKIGVPASAIRFDDANKRIPVPTADRQPDRRPARHAAGPAPAVLHPSRHRAALRRRQAAARGRSHRLGRHDGARRRCPHRRRAARRAGRDADQAQAAASADHAALHGPRGKRPARRARAEPRRSRRRGDVHQCRRPARLGADHRRGRPGELGGRDQGPGLACRRRAGEGHLGHAGRRHRPRRGQQRRLVRQGRQGRTDAAPAMSASSAARTASRPATRPTSSPTTPSSRARRAAPKLRFASQIVDGYEAAFAKAQGRGEGS